MSDASPGLPALERIEEEWLDPALIESVPVDWVRRNGLVPFRWKGQVAIAGADPAAIQGFEDLSLLLGTEAVWVTAPAPEIQRAIDRCYFRRVGQAGHGVRIIACLVELGNLKVVVIANDQSQPFGMRGHGKNAA